MKVLKDASQVLRILMEKKFQLCKKFNEAEELEASRISGQERSIGCVRGHIRYVMSDHREFDEVDMAAIYEYVANTKKATPRALHGPCRKSKRGWRKNHDKHRSSQCLGRNER